MSVSQLESLKIKAKLLQKAKRRSGVDIALKEAFEVLARNAGFVDWREFKKSIDQEEKLFPLGSSAYWKTWYANYTEALAHLREKGGYLIPYRQQFFVCEEHYLNALGITGDDEDLKKVGHDWARPLDESAYQKLINKLK